MTITEYMGAAHDHDAAARVPALEATIRKLQADIQQRDEELRLRDREMARLCERLGETCGPDEAVA